MESTTTKEWEENELTFDVMGGKDVDGSFMSNTITHNPSLLYFVLKRLLDIIIALIGLIVLMPVILVIAFCIKLYDGGNIFYLRKMVGLEGRPFTLMKFRTMIPNAEAYLENHPALKLEFQKNMKLRDDPRVTRLGRFLRKAYLDELPQLFNVIAGHMSLVGPRAIHEGELALYGVYGEKRHSVKPGITGLWQISPTRYTCYGERIPLDMQYIDNRSMRLDLIILIKTLKIFIVFSGV